MGKLLSYSHLLVMLKNDVRYKWLVILGYRSGGAFRNTVPTSETSYTEALNWVTKWIQDNVKANTGNGASYKTCREMMQHLNNYISTVQYSSEYTKEPKI